MEFEQIYNEYYKEIYCFVLAMNSNDDVAEEITQETFLTVQEHPEYREYYLFLKKELFLGFLVYRQEFLQERLQVNM